jgi:molybdopterin molybdotransferase
VKSVDEARAEILSAFAPVGVERVSLLSALGRFCASELVAAHDLPAFDNSAMDGYAARAVDLVNASAQTPCRLEVRGESRAGEAPAKPLEPHTVQRIFTGAALPHGADTVELQENVAREGDVVTFQRPLVAFANVRRRGSDVARERTLLAAHSPLGAGELALLAGQDVASVDVFRRPRVAIVCTGDELRDIGAPARPGAIVNTNAYALTAQVLEAGAEPLLLPSAPDVQSAIEARLREALVADVVVLSGGVSVGDYDLVRPALAAAGVALDFWKVRMKPGKPLSFGRHGHKPVVGLPGNPVSAFVSFELFVRPGLRKMLGDLRPWRMQLPVRLRHDLGRSCTRKAVSGSRSRCRSRARARSPHSRASTASWRSPPRAQRSPATTGSRPWCCVRRGKTHDRAENFSAFGFEKRFKLRFCRPESGRLLSSLSGTWGLTWPMAALCSAAPRKGPRGPSS